MGLLVFFKVLLFLKILINLAFSFKDSANFSRIVGKRS